MKDTACVGLFGFCPTSHLIIITASSQSRVAKQKKPQSFTSAAWRGCPRSVPAGTMQDIRDKAFLLTAGNLARSQKGGDKLAKWTSVLFSDIRNKVGNQVVFSSWKGRPYMRAFVTPANPKTLKQQAQRAMMKEAVKRSQAILGTPASKTAWNNAALEFLISGFNLITKYVTGSSVKESSKLATSVTCEGWTNIPLSDAYVGIFLAADDSFVAKAKIDTATFSGVQVTGLTTGTAYKGLIGRADVLGSDVFDEYVCHHYKNIATGTADAFTFTTP